MTLNSLPQRSYCANIAKGRYYRRVFFPIFSTFFPQEKQEKQILCSYFGNLTDGKILGRMNVQSMETLKQENVEIRKLCENKKHGKYGNLGQKWFVNNGPKPTTHCWEYCTAPWQLHRRAIGSPFNNPFEARWNPKMTYQGTDCCVQGPSQTTVHVRACVVWKIKPPFFNFSVEKGSGSGHRMKAICEYVVVVHRTTSSTNDLVAASSWSLPVERFLLLFALGIIVGTLGPVD